MERNPRATVKASSKSLTHEVIAEAAVAILKRDGPDSLSFRKVGEVLGVSHVTVYRRCGSFDGLLDICADHVAAGFPRIDGTVDWATATEFRFYAAYEMWAAHADLVLLMRGRAWLGKNMMSRFHEPAMRSILDAGMSPGEAQDFFSVLYRFTIGSVIAISANPWTPWESRQAVERLGADQFPALASVSREVDYSDIHGVFRNTLRRLTVILGPQGRAGQPAQRAIALGG